ncbi:MAG: response regulator transcription factor [Hungatella sp.]|jgi:DNA-binding response OmpR family regulator|nr:response regulator transcription factor [Hungatella sp.]
MKRKILIICNEYNICHTINKAIGNNVISFAQSLSESIEKVERELFDLVILDIEFPEIDGCILLNVIIKLCSAPVLAVTSDSSVEERLRLLELGASDCVHYPFDMDDFIVRTAACIPKNREEAKLKPAVIHRPPFMADPDKREVTVKGKPMELTKKEFDILYLLVCNPGVVFSKKQLYSIIWNDKYIYDDSNIMSHIGRLRKKLGAAGDCIQTVWGIGYRFCNEDKDLK